MEVTLPGKAGGARRTWTRPASPDHSDPLDLFIFDPRTRRGPGSTRALAGSPPVAKILATYRNARVLEDFPLQSGPASDRFRRIIDRQRSIRAFVDGDPAVDRLPTDKQLRAFGHDLFESLFSGGVRRLYDGARRRADGRHLDIILTSAIDWVAELPWEFAFDTDRNAFLATEEVNFARNVVTAVPMEEIAPRHRDLSVLVVAAQPLGWEPLSTDEEVALLLRGFHPLIAAGWITVELLTAATPSTLHRRLAQAQSRGRPFDVVHFIGHGEFDEGEGSGSLVFDDGSGGSQHLGGVTLREMFSHRSVRVLFLNACDSSRGGRSDFNRGVAQALVAGGVPVVVGNQFKVLDPSAITFAGHFYWSLAQGLSVGYAAREARVALRYSLDGDAIDWAVPVVFARKPGEALCLPTPREQQPAASPPTPKPGRAGRRQSAAERIGLWDINGFVPSLPQVAERLSAAQSMFAVEAVDLTAPLGSWRLVRSATKPAQGYVYAESVVARFAQLPAKLRLRKLLCLTSLPLGDRDLLNLPRWDHEPRDRLAIFSFAGFADDFTRLGLSRERAVANFVAACLAGVSWHIEGVENCPCFFNGQRFPHVVAGPLSFCPICRRRLAARVRRGRASPDLLDALEAILALDWGPSPSAALPVKR